MAAVMRSARIDKGFVYVISAPNGYVKVGSSARPYERFSMIQGASPLMLTLAYICECANPVDIEIAAHKNLDQFRRHREWFEIASSIAIDVVRSVLCATGDTPLSAPARPKKGLGVPAVVYAQISETALPREAGPRNSITVSNADPFQKAI